MEVSSTPSRILSDGVEMQDVHLDSPGEGHMQMSLPHQDAAKSDAPPRPEGELAAIFTFRYPLVFVAFLKSFAHGANDTANATAAFQAIYNAYTDGLYACASVETPWWIASVAGLFVGLGVVGYGHRVIQTIGKDLTYIDYQVGLAIEVASMLTVVLASVGGFPVSTTHCQVGATVCVGYVSSGRRGVKLGLVGKIFISWVVTLPLAGGLAAILTATFRKAIETANI